MKSLIITLLLTSGLFAAEPEPNRIKQIGANIAKLESQIEKIDNQIRELNAQLATVQKNLDKIEAEKAAIKAIMRP